VIDRQLNVDARNEKLKELQEGIGSIEFQGRMGEDFLTKHSEGGTDHAENNCLHRVDCGVRSGRFCAGAHLA
jgi:hypothetical protein